MKLVIDASNIRKGGGVTHLQEILRAANFEESGVTSVTVWAPKGTLERLEERKGLVRKSNPLIEKGGLHAYWFRKCVLDGTIAGEENLLWVPGGTYLGHYRPYVTMVRNLLPFVVRERNRYRYSLIWLRLHYLRRVQLQSFRRATGLIYISRCSQEVVGPLVNSQKVRQQVVHHGLSPRFQAPVRRQRPFSAVSPAAPLRILYVSSIDHYKHQDVLVLAAHQLRERGISVAVDLVGAAYPPANRRLQSIMDAIDPNRSWVRWHGEAEYRQMQQFYEHAELLVCLSSCEAFGMVLLEAMASGLPVVSSNCRTFTEIHAGSCPSVEPEDVTAVAQCLENLIRDHSARALWAESAHQRARDFTWQRCADETFEFLASCAPAQPLAGKRN